MGNYEYLVIVFVVLYGRIFWFDGIVRMMLVLLVVRGGLVFIFSLVLKD